MKTRSLAAIAAVAALAATADPSVSVDSVVQDPETHVVTVSYTLSGESAAVTAEMLVNGSAVGSSHVARRGRRHGGGYADRGCSTRYRSYGG